MNKNKFTTKGNTLLNLRNKLNIFQIPDLQVFTLQEIKDEGFEKIVEGIYRYFSCEKIVVRSSALAEDSNKDSAAGKYESVLNVDRRNKRKVKAAIKKVISSYEMFNNKDQIIIQEYITDVSISGVIFTREINTGAPYFVINYDDVTGLTDSVTSGKGTYSNRILYIHHDSGNEIQSERFIKIYESVKELIRFLHSDCIDIEFALSRNLVPYLFQVRPITTASSWNKNIDDLVKNKLSNFKKFLKKNYFYDENETRKKLSYSFSQMTDWNPAEIIGNIPRKLSFSLYRNLITNKIWSDARVDLGYTKPKDIDLVKEFCGHPYINVRASIESFIPATLSNEIRLKLVNHFMKQFIDNPEQHDKIEFEIIPTTYTLNIDNNLKKLVGDSLNKSELEKYKISLRNITIDMLIGRCSISKYMEKIKTIEELETNLKITNYQDLIKYISKCKLGTFAFAALARHGFVGKAILNSLQECNLLTEKRITELYASFDTVASEFVNDRSLMSNGKLRIKDFIKKYGHLRPGTYDILSPRYDQMDISIFDYPRNETEHINKVHFLLTTNEEKKITNTLKRINITEINPQELLNYCTEAIKAREYSKFIFTKLVSAIIENLASICKNYSLTRDDISHLDLQTILKYIKQVDNIKSSKLKKISEIVNINRKTYEISQSIRFPAVLSSLADINIIPFQRSIPNFITQKKIVASIFKLNSSRINQQQLDILSNKIILIEGADPGFDWLFSYPIAGLITRFGGANSHMAIRCAEFSIPAAIGCGDHHYFNLNNASVVSLNCMEKKLTIVS